MTTAAPARVGGLSRLGPQSNGQHPSWLVETRRAAFSWVGEHGFPTSKDEDWKYTRLGPILEVPFEPALARIGHQLSSTTIDSLVADPGGAWLVFVNGHFAAELSRLGKLPEGVTVTSLGSVLAEDDERLEMPFADLLGEHHHAFAALNAVLAADGAFVHLPADTKLDEPIELVYVAVGGQSPLVSSPRSIVLAGPRSRVAIVETYVAMLGGQYCTNAVTQVVVEEGARVEHYKVQDEAETAFHLALLEVHQGPQSSFVSHSIALGSSIARHEVRVHLEAEGAEVRLNGLYMPQGHQHHDNPILIEHAAPRCTSRQLYKGVVDGRGHGVFNGHIIVRPGAFGTDASQTNKNLLLSDHAEVDTRPRLEILDDDVKVTHGAAVGSLDEDALFYLRSRGVPYDEARSLLTYAFAKEMVELIDLEPLRARVEALVASRQSSRGEEAGT